MESYLGRPVVFALRRPSAGSGSLCLSLLLSLAGCGTVGEHPREEISSVKSAVSASEDSLQAESNTKSSFSADSAQDRPPSLESGATELAQMLAQHGQIPQQPEVKSVASSLNEQRPLTRSIPALTVAWNEDLNQPLVTRNRTDFLEARIRNTRASEMEFKLLLVTIDAAGEHHFKLLSEDRLPAKGEVDRQISVDELPVKTAGGPTAVFVAASWTRGEGRSALRFDSPRLMITFDEEFKHAQVRSEREQLRHNAMRLAANVAAWPTHVMHGDEEIEKLAAPGQPGASPHSYTIVVPDGTPGFSVPSLGTSATSD